MKKLFLTSFEFTTGDNRYKEQRLVMVQSNELGADQTHEDVAYQKINRWFPVNYPESKLISIIAHPTIIGYAEDAQIKNKRNSVRVLDGSWNLSIVKPPIDHPDDGYSDNVLIDTDGRRKDYTIGWYDFDDKEWRHIGEGDLNPDQLVWQLLPLAKYDKQ